MCDSSTLQVLALFWITGISLNVAVFFVVRYGFLRWWANLSPFKKKNLIFHTKYEVSIGEG